MRGVQLAFLKNLSATDLVNLKRTVPCTLAINYKPQSNINFVTKYKGWVKERLARSCNPLSKEHRLKNATNEWQAMYPAKLSSESWTNLDTVEMKFLPSISNKL